MATLTLDRIFNSGDFADEGFDRPRWSDEGSNYTTLRRRANDSSQVVGKADMTSTTAAASDTVNTIVHEIIFHDAATGEEQVFVSFDQLIPENETTPIPIDDYVVSADKKHVLIFTNAQKVWRLRTRGSYWILDLDGTHNPGQYPLRQLGGGSRDSCDLLYAAFSPDAKRVAYVKNNNIHVEDLATHIITALTSDGSENIINGTFDWVYEEELGLYRGFKWSLDGKFIAYWQVDQTDVKRVALVNNTSALYPVITHIPYPKCGETNPSVRIGIVPTSSHITNPASTPITTWVPLEGSSRDHYVCDISYAANTGELVLQRLNRLQNELKILVVNTQVVNNEIQSCSVNTLYSETTDHGWINMREGGEVTWISTKRRADGAGMSAKPFLHVSEKGGWNQLYLVAGTGDNAEGERQQSMYEITPQGYDVISVCRYDEDAGIVYFVASPDDPIRRYLYSVNIAELIEKTCDCSSNSESVNTSIDSNELPCARPVVQRVTPTSPEFRGTNSYELSKDGKYAVHSFSSTECPPRTSIIAVRDSATASADQTRSQSQHQSQHQAVCVLATNEKLLQAWRAIECPLIEFFTVPITIPVGEADAGKEILLDGYCLKPPGFDPTKKYPVLFHVYGEPAAQIARDQYQGRLGLWHRMLVQRGTVVVCVDNRGTPSPRGSAWRKCIYGRIGDVASGDQAQAVRAILNSRTYLDRDRVAVWGWSGGGSMTLNAMFRYPDLYKTGVSVAPVPDMHLYDTIYQERYMGIPQQGGKDGYYYGSPVTYAHQMDPDANLLLIHGTGDDNCHYQGMEVLINRLVQYNKHFQMLSYPNRTHSISEGAGTTRHLFESITRFFEQNNITGKQQ